MSRRGAVLAAVLVSLPIAPAAAQQSTGVVLRFRGPGGGQVRRVVVRAIQSDVDLVGQNDATSAAGRLGVDLDTDEGIAAVAQDMGLAVVVTGQVVGRGRRSSAQIDVHDDTGVAVASRTVRPALGGPARRRITAAAQEAVQEALAAIAARPPPEPEQPPEQPAWATQPPPEEPEEPSEPGAVPLIDMYLDLGARTRKADVVLTTLATRQYDAGLFAELGFRVEARPLGRSDGAGRGLYLGMSFAHSLGLSSTDEDTGEDVSTRAARFAAEAGYLYVIGERTAEVGGTLGFGIDSFHLGANSVMPSAKYPHLRIALAGRVAVVQQLMAIGVEAGFRIAFGVGDLADAFGDGASAKGFDIGLSVGGALDVGFAYQLRLGFQRTNLDFSGMFADAEGDHGSDRAVIIGVLLGWEIR